MEYELEGLDPLPVWQEGETHKWGTFGDETVLIRRLMDKDVDWGGDRKACVAFLESIGESEGVWIAPGEPWGAPESWRRFVEGKNHA